jgi:hypothetical protein
MLKSDGRARALRLLRQARVQCVREVIQAPVQDQPHCDMQALLGQHKDEEEVQVCLIPAGRASWSFQKTAA